MQNAVYNILLTLYTTLYIYIDSYYILGIRFYTDPRSVLMGTIIIFLKYSDTQIYILSPNNRVVVEAEKNPGNTN